MAFRILFAVVALSLVFSTGCRNRSNYQPACAPAVVAVTPVAPCPTPAPIPAPPPPGVLVPR